MSTPFLDHIVVDQLVRKTIVFCEQKRPEMAGIHWGRALMARD